MDFPTALLLSVVAALSACGASGVAGGSLLLIRSSCSLFVHPERRGHAGGGCRLCDRRVRDSAETALNSSTDVVFTAAVCQKTKVGAIRPLREQGGKET